MKLTILLLALCMTMLANPFDTADSAFQKGDFRDAMEAYEQLFTDANTSPEEIVQRLEKYNQCLVRLNLNYKFENMVQRAIQAHPKDWRIALAWTGYHGPWTPNRLHFGTSPRDRVYLIRLLLRIRPFMEADETAIKHDHANYYSILASLIGYEHNGDANAWRLQILTDLEKTPDTDDEFGRYGQGAPVDFNGEPIFYEIPVSWEAARNDGERWRWAMEQAGKYGLSTTMKLKYADFLQRQFDVTSIPQYRLQNDPELYSTVLKIDSLPDNETFAYLATGVRKITLPERHSFIAIYKSIPATDGYYHTACDKLARVYKNRRQYDKAAEYYKILDNAKELADIEEPWCSLNPAKPQPANKNATVFLTFRNATSVSFTAWKIDMAKMLEEYFKINPKKYWEIISLDDPTQAIYEENKWIFKGKSKYFTGKPIRWESSLTPREHHFDTTAEVATPLAEPGFYFIEAKVGDNHFSRQTIYIEKTRIVLTESSQAEGYWQVLDAATGTPIPNAKCKVHIRNFDDTNSKPGKPKINHSSFSATTDAEGFVQISKDKWKELRSNYILVETTAEGSLAFLESYLEVDRPYLERFNDRVYGVTDRPVYKPGDTVKLRIWQTDAQFPSASQNSRAQKKTSFLMRNPKHEEVVKEEVTLDEYGAYTFQWEIPADATLGMYRFDIPHGNRFSFRVEEYQKPEFEVSISSPEKPLLLGEKTTLDLTANYYFGGPVTDATVHLSIRREDYHAEWWPVRPWDWYYGNGYVKLLEDYLWYPHWTIWGHCPWTRRGMQSEQILEMETEIPEDGHLSIPLDTSSAAESYKDRDHKYIITAEVRDKSRRTIMAEASVFASRKPYQVQVTANRGYYTVNERIRVSAFARRIDQLPVEGTAHFQLLRIRYQKDGTPVETPVADATGTSAKGMAEADFTAAQAGQYRIVCDWDNGDGATVQGGAIFSVRNTVQDNDDDFRYNDLELIPDKAEYAPGETMRLAVNTAQANSTVMLFLRPQDGRADEKPLVLHLNGKSTIVEIPIEEKDMPNFFIEGYTLANGQLHNVHRNIPVPPQNKLLRVEIRNLPETVEPGKEASFEVHVADMDGNPLSVGLTLALYDRSVDAIASDCLPGDLRTTFWKWARNHHTMVQQNYWRFLPRLGEKEPRMSPLSIFEEIASRAADANDGGGATNRTMKFANKMIVCAAREESVGMAMGASMDFAPAPMMADAGGELNAPAVTVRKDFADTAYWNALVKTDETGIARFTVPMPDNLTDWKLNVWAVTENSRVGFASETFHTAKDLMVRLVSPRFFIEQDELILSALVNSKLPLPENVEVSIEPPPTLQLLDAPKQTVTVRPNSDARVDWRAKVVKAGKTLIRVVARAAGGSDGMEQTFTAYVHGMEKQVPFSVMLPPDREECSFPFTVPKKIRKGSAQIVVRWSPSLALAMTDAIPYLLDYPYGCTEQTLNRFLPAVLVQKTLEKCNLNLAEIAEHANNLNAQELGDAETRKKQWKKLEANPVFEEKELKKILAKGIKDLQKMQCSDGGWGWFSGSGEHSYAHTTAIVVRGFLTAQRYGIDIPKKPLERGIQWLEKYQKGELAEIQSKEENTKMKADSLDALVFCVLSEAGRRVAKSEEMKQMEEELFKVKNDLPLYGIALYTMGLHLNGEVEKREELLHNLAQYLTIDQENQTATLSRDNSRYWWYWYGDSIETDATYLRLLVAVNPRDEVAPMLVKYLLNNRKHSTYWNSTRDTALCLEAFAEYLTATGEASPDMTLEILLDGKVVAEQTITAENIFTIQNELTLDNLAPGEHTITFRRAGKGPLYTNSYLQYFDLQDRLTSAGLEVKAERRFFRIQKETVTTHTADFGGRPKEMATTKELRVPLEEGDPIQIGDVIEVEVELTSKNNYEYILVEDFKPAGANPLDSTSGYDWESGAYVEFRENRVAMMLRTLPRGGTRLSYRLRAETPGTFHALPTIATGMYAPELKGNSDEFLLKVNE